MKKVVSVMVVLAMSVMLACGAFAASADVDSLKALVNSAKGISDSQKAQAIAFIDDYAEEHADSITADTVSSLTALYNKAVASAPAERTEAYVTDLVNQGVSILKDAGITVTASISVSNGTTTITGSVSAPDTVSVSFAGSIDSATTGGTTNPVAPPSTVIKNTGVNVASVGIMAIAIVATLGIAVVGARKKGLLAR